MTFEIQYTHFENVCRLYLSMCASAPLRTHAIVVCIEYIGYELRLEAESHRQANPTIPLFALFVCYGPLLCGAVEQHDEAVNIYPMSMCSSGARALSGALL